MLRIKKKKICLFFALFIFFTTYMKNNIMEATQDVEASTEDDSGYHSEGKEHPSPIGMLEE